MVIFTEYKKELSAMFNVLFWFLIIAVAVYSIRRYILNRQQPQLAFAPFEGELYLAGTSFVAKKPGTSGRTIICMPGFLEDMRYFTELYADSKDELIFINNANYHCPFPQQALVRVGWNKQNPHAIGTIKHDAFVMAQVIQQLAGNTTLCLHGHSRGGAVVLEICRQFPELCESVSALLEAPVLPQGKLAGQSDKLMKRGGLILFPLVLALIRYLPLKLRLLSPAMNVSTPYKRQIFGDISRVSKQYQTTVTNVKDIIDWQASANWQAFNHFQSITVMVGERDSILSRRAMIDSTTQLPDIKLIKTHKTDHFIAIEQPQLVLEAIQLWKSSYSS
jgi:pimeloyl-ACP methyl ester carboxylesterase